MRVKIIFILLGILVVLACSKNKFVTRPSLELLKIENNPTTSGADSILSIYLKYTDREGDINGSKLTYLRIRTNARPISNPAINDQIDSSIQDMPDFTPNIKGEIKVMIPYSFMNEDPTVNDSMVFKIVLTDLAGNSSDTLLTPKVVAKQ